MARQILTAIVDADTRKMRAGFNKATNIAGALAGAIVKVGIAAAAAFTAAVVHTAKFGDTIDKMSKRTGIAVQELQALRVASMLAGADIGTTEKGIQKMAQSIFDLSRDLSTQVALFDELGVSLSDVDGKPVAEQFAIILKALGAMDDKSRQIAVGKGILGRGGVDLIPLAESFEAAQKIAKERLVFLDEDQIKQTADMIDLFTLLKNQVGGIVRLLTVQAFPGINQGLDSISRRIKSFTDSDDFAEMQKEAARFFELIKESLIILSGDADFSIAQAFKSINNSIEIIMKSGILEYFKDIFEAIGNAATAFGKLTNQESTTSEKVQGGASLLKQSAGLGLALTPSLIPGNIAGSLAGTQGANSQGSFAGLLTQLKRIVTNTQPLQKTVGGV